MRNEQTLFASSEIDVWVHPTFSKALPKFAVAPGVINGQRWNYTANGIPAKTRTGPGSFIKIEFDRIRPTERNLSREYSHPTYIRLRVCSYARDLLGSGNSVKDMEIRGGQGTYKEGRCD